MNGGGGKSGERGCHPVVVLNEPLEIDQPKKTLQLLHDSRCQQICHHPDLIRVGLYLLAFNHISQETYRLGVEFTLLSLDIIYSPTAFGKPNERG